MNIDEIKQYLRVGTYDDDDTILRLSKVAQNYIKNSVTDYEEKLKNAEFAKMAEMAQLAIIAELYENRNDTKQQDYSFTIRSIIEQLKWSY